RAARRYAVRLGHFRDLLSARHRTLDRAPETGALTLAGARRRPGVHVPGVSPSGGAPQRGGGTLDAARPDARIHLSLRASVDGLLVCGDDGARAWQRARVDFQRDVLDVDWSASDAPVGECVDRP